MSKKNAHVVQVLAGAAVLAGFGYALVRRSGVRASRPTRSDTRSLDLDLDLAESRPSPVAANVETGQATWSDYERISSAPDALDVALDLDGVFAGESTSGVTAQPNEHVPPARVADDQEAPAPEDLGRAWLAQATESERSLSFADTLPNVDDLPDAIDGLAENEDSNGDEDEDETTAEYVRRHRISSAG